MDRNGSNKQVLIDNPAGIVQSPTWSIDGNSILYTHDVSGNESIDGRMLDSRIFRLNLSSMDTTALSQNKPQGTNDMHPRYSPTGAQIVFTNAPNDDSQPPRIMIMGDDGESREELVEEGRLPFWK
jgi:TolB protein